MKGFKDFVLRGNLIELAVAFIMAAAFAAVVTTFTNWLLSLIPAGATDFGDTKFGLFLTALVSFLVIAAVVYFFIVTPYERVKTPFRKAGGGGFGSRRGRAAQGDPRPARRPSRRHRLSMLVDDIKVSDRWGQAARERMRICWKQ